MSNGDDNAPVQRATPVDPGVTVKRATPAGPPPAAPGPQRATLAPGAANQYQGTATTFADYPDLERYKKDKAAALAKGATPEQAEQAGLKYGDNWRGIGGINTGTHYGVAVPEAYLRRQFGDDQAAWRTARAQVNYNGQTIQVPIIDTGPGKAQQEENPHKIMDISNLLYQGLGGPNAKSDNVQFNLVPNAGPDYLKEPDKAEQEQMMIGNRFKNNPAAQAGPEPAPTPWVRGSAAPETPPNPNPPTQKLSDDEIREQNAAALDDTSEDPAYEWPPH